MLEVYKKLFDEFDKRSVDYVVYKGLDHLADDLNGERGDIDILTGDIKKIENILLFQNWIKVLKNYYPKYFFYLHEKKNLMLDIENRIKIGEKPYKPYFIEIDISRLKITNFGNVKILSYEDYIPLMFLLRVTESHKKENLDKFRSLFRNSVVDGYIKEVVENLTEVKWDEIEKDIIETSSWQELQNKYKAIILKNTKVDKRSLIAQQFKWIIEKYKIIQKRIMKTPPYRIRKKGYLVAFIGNDGAGKSSMIEAILRNDYFQCTGTKMIYFGNNQYVLPCLNQFMKKGYSNKIINLTLAVLASFDKKIRAIIAYYYIYQGYIVLADRYVYDDLMSLYFNSRIYTKNVLKKLYRYIVEPRMILRPEITFFLDVEPEIAYARKQDYDFEIVKQNINRYREFMSKFYEVVKIDANQSQDNVLNEIMKRLYAKDFEVNQKF